MYIASINDFIYGCQDSQYMTPVESSTLKQRSMPKPGWNWTTCFDPSRVLDYPFPDMDTLVALVMGIVM